MAAPSYLRYSNQNATRNQHLAPDLVNALGFLGDLGITAEVFSGGQPGKGSGGARVGSTRHDHGNAADVRFFQGDRRLDWANPQDLPLFEQIVSQGRKAGLTGFGAGPGYMGAGTMHVGFGSPGVWGAGGKAANAPEWLRNAYNGSSSGGTQVASASGAINDILGTSAASPSGGAMAYGSEPMQSGIPGQSRKIGGLGGMGGWDPPREQVGIDTGAILRALAAAAFAGDLGVVPGFLQQSMSDQQQRADRDYAKAWDEYVFRTGLEENALEREQARADRYQDRDWAIEDDERDRRNGIADYRTKLEIDQEFGEPKPQRTFQGPDGNHYYEDGSRVLPGVAAPDDRFRQATPEEAAAHGAAAGQFGPDGRFYPINPPSGMSVESDGAGGFRLMQGPGAGSGGAKVPTNFEPDPNNPDGVRPIAGGPGEQLPAEVAGRVGIADSFLGQAPALRQQILAGGVTGPWDRLQAGNNSSSPQAGIYRQLQSGADALQRLLTGAGMTENEAAIYAQRYLPSFTDSAESAANKLDQMVREIENVRAAALRGRGGPGATVTPNGPTVGAPQATPNSLRDKYGLE